MKNLMSMETIFDGEKIIIPKTIKHEPCKVVVTFLDRLPNEEDEQLIDMVLKSDPAYSFLKSKKEDIYTDDDLIERFA